MRYEVLPERRVELLKKLLNEMMPKVYPVIKHIDLDQEVVIVDGKRLTEARAEQISEEIMEAFYKYKGIKFVPRKLQN